MSNMPHQHPRQRAYIVAVYSGKGGVGKTTIVNGLAATAGFIYPNQVLALDVDPREATLGVHTAIIKAGNDPRYECRADTNPEHLRQLGRVRASLLFADLPGNLNVPELFQPVAEEADVLLIPTTDSGLDMQQTVATYKYALAMVRQYRAADRPPLQIHVVINNMDPQYPQRIIKMRRALEKRAIPVLESELHTYRAWSNCITAGIPITDYDEYGSGRPKVQIRQLFQEVMALNKEAAHA